MPTISTLYIPADKGQPVACVHIERGDYDAIYAYTSGFYDVIATHGNEELQIFIHGNGKTLELQPNCRASLLLWYADHRWVNLDHIVGDVLVAGPPDMDGHTTSLPSDLHDLVFNTNRYRIEILMGHEWRSNTLRFNDYFVALAASMRNAQMLRDARAWRAVRA